MISSLDELHSVARCIAGGAEDYLPKPFNPTLLRARIGACLEKKQLRDQERRTYHALVESQSRLAAELGEAAAYVKSILPAPLVDGGILTDWHYQPSTQLGGDAFGYHWLDDSHFAIFLLDVSGHGVGAALLSVSAVNVLRSQTLPVDFRDPAAVLAAMNKAFQMDSQNNMFFSLWYGVYDRRNRELRFADAGHPPAVLFPPRAAGAGGPIQLRAPGMVIGCFPDQAYSAPSVEAPPGGRLYLFSDGAYELTSPDGAIWGVEAFLAELESAQKQSSGRVEAVVARLRALRGGGDLEDDLSIVEVTLV
jgi:sigma-B regulation protein RsbU (phosphoserine phosphatase)